MEFKDLVQKIKSTSNEFQLRTYLEKYIQEKTGIEGLWEENRADLLYKSILIETKRYKNLDNRKNLEEAIENRIISYMKRLLVRYSVLTDGKSIYFFEMKEDFNIEEIESPYGNQFNKANLDFLLNLIKNKSPYLSPLSLVLTFGDPENNKFIKEIIKNFYDFFKNTQSIKKNLLFNEWEKLFKISEEYKTVKEEVQKRRKALSKIFDTEIINEREESEALFVLHNILSIIVKLLIYNNFEKLGFLDKFDLNSFNDIENLKAFMKKLENGEIFYSLGIYNLTIYDYFSWYIDDHIRWDNKIQESIYHLIQEINKFIPLKNLENSVDYVEELYRKYIPKEIRHSFGEFFTPHIIAQEVVNNIAKIQPKDKVIDPTCGSGTFLIEALKIKKQAGLGISDIFKTLCGIDLNPINVLLAKFNIITNLLDKLEESLISDAIIPIFIGDSSYIPVITQEDNIDIIKYKWISFVSELEDIPEIILPTEFVKYDKFFDIMEKIKDYIEKDISDLSKNEKASNFLIDKIKEYEKKTGKKLLNKNIEEKIKSWILNIRKYHQTNLNSIWLFIFINYLYPFAITPYDKVIGNPPWVRWSNLPSYYKEKIKNTLRERGLFSSDKNTGGIDLNIYALITYNSLKYLLKANETLTFLLPKSSLQNKSLEGFRKLCMDEYGEIIEPIYFSEGKFFEEVDLEFIILTLKKK